MLRLFLNLKLSAFALGLASCASGLNKVPREIPLGWSEPRRPPKLSIHGMNDLFPPGTRMNLTFDYESFSVNPICHDYVMDGAVNWVEKKKLSEKLEVTLDSENVIDIEKQMGFPFFYFCEYKLKTITLNIFKDNLSQEEWGDFYYIFYVEELQKDQEDIQIRTLSSDIVKEDFNTHALDLQCEEALQPRPQFLCQINDRMKEKNNWGKGVLRVESIDQDFLIEGLRLGFKKSIK